MCGLYHVSTTLSFTKCAYNYINAALNVTANYWNYKGYQNLTGIIGLGPKSLLFEDAAKQNWKNA
jgi:hypothetical protein